MASEEMTIERSTLREAVLEAKHTGSTWDLGALGVILGGAGGHCPGRQEPLLRGCLKQLRKQLPK